MNIEEKAEIVMEMRGRLISRREELELSKKELGHHLCQSWDMKVDSAAMYISDLEQMYTLSRLEGLTDQVKKPAHPLHTHQQRISDYLAALGLRGEEADKMIKGIEHINPNFRIVYSDIQPYLEQNTPRPDYGPLLRNIEMAAEKDPSVISEIEQIVEKRS